MTETMTAAPGPGDRDRDRDADELAAAAEAIHRADPDESPWRNPGDARAAGRAAASGVGNRRTLQAVRNAAALIRDGRRGPALAALLRTPETAPAAELPNRAGILPPRGRGRRGGM
jgi:hypothetical protein